MICGVSRNVLQLKRLHTKLDRKSNIVSCVIYLTFIAYDKYTEDDVAQTYYLQVHKKIN